MASDDSAPGPAPRGADRGASRTAPGAEPGARGAVPARPPWWRRGRALRALPPRPLRVLGRLLSWLGVLLVAAVGAGIGFALAPGHDTWVGPLETEVRVHPSLEPGVEVDLPPVGQITFDTHEAPIEVTARIEAVDLDAASRLVRSPQQLLALELTAADTVRAATVRAATYSAACGVGGAVLAGVVVYRARRRALQTGAACVAALLVAGGAAAASFEPGALQQPRFTGLLSRAPYVASSTQEALERLESYRSGLSDVVRSVSTLYAVSGSLPVLGDGLPGAGAGEDVTTVLHISDLHLNPLGFDLVEDLVEQFGVQVVVDTGDVTTLGTAVESSFLNRIGALDVPYVFVRGNHDSAQTQGAVAAQEGAVVLDEGETAEVAGLRFAGKGDPVFTPEGEGSTAEGDAEEVQRRSNEVLAAGIEEWGSGNADDPVDVALVHDPSGLEPLMGRVPLVLAGHLHKRSVTLDDSGTRVMVEGTTGGAGITSAGLDRLADGAPLPLSATLLYFAEDTDELLAYDEVTVGGLGLAEVSLQRTVLTDADRPELVQPATDPTVAPTESATADPTADPTAGPSAPPGPAVTATASTATAAP
ncbi:metallophosphoesterase [Paenibacillus sp. TRM 82003]|uniref:metallophosphoesterase n=1 Tax=Kineococcus sp. TRM81007 TaxID=2925831 RepID=UPI001F5A8DE6|nr:metallophosphoesterase [Kineococcus sp. TRM81007]MCI2238631.1 metallophosphoesterase [Kineococcus sp. TRM81007]MCI3927293.1 metallophosphoesterase [Paenibacillus sp. TRM 82003]